ncbi:MAG: MFS transporter [Candidatus Binatia bacterium]
MNQETAAATVATSFAGERPTPYIRHLLFFICVSTLFEGYDVLIINLALPYLGQDFHADSRTLGFAVSLISVGTIAAFLPVRLADRYGRRPVFLAAATGYTFFTVLTAFSVGLYDFVVYQFIARLFMVTEVGVGSIILTEELPARSRGAGIALMFSAGLVGGVLGSALFPFLVDTDLGWRMLYLVGGGLFLLLVFYWNKLQETQRWQYNHSTNTPPARSLFASFSDLKVPFQAIYRRKLIAGATIWFTTNFWSATCLFFFSYYVINERGWTATEVGHTLTIGYILALVAYLSAGPLMDLAGRRFTASMYFIVAACSAIVCFQAQSATVITVAYIVVLGMNAVWAISATITSEIFPTSIRGTANAVVNNLLGRTGMVLSPALVGQLSIWLGSVGEAVAWLAVLNFFCVPVILWSLSETRGQTLEEIA